MENLIEKLKVDVEMRCNDDLMFSIGTQHGVVIFCNKIKLMKGSMIVECKMHDEIVCYIPAEELESISYLMVN